MRRRRVGGGKYVIGTTTFVEHIFCIRNLKFMRWMFDVRGGWRRLSVRVNLAYKVGGRNIPGYYLLRKPKL